MNIGPIQIGRTDKSLSGSAITPALLLAGIGVTGAVGVLHYAPAHGMLAAILGLGGFGLAAAQIIWFTFKEPDRLHNERHLEARMAISLFGHRMPEGIAEYPIEPAKLTTNPVSNKEGAR